ncbi:hypothetical protein GQ54DRAFT_75633 [Martensiomyces pterosporus]|nr:hypothetical protein GQ54DRAFT_75633 [Martensiomyces pterosporus]
MRSALAARANSWQTRQARGRAASAVSTGHARPGYPCTVRSGHGDHGLVHFVYAGAARQLGEPYQPWLLHCELPAWLTSAAWLGRCLFLGACHRETAAVPRPLSCTLSSNSAETVLQHSSSAGIQQSAPLVSPGVRRTDETRSHTANAPWLSLSVPNAIGLQRGASSNRPFVSCLTLVRRHCAVGHSGRSLIPLPK